MVAVIIPVVGGTTADLVGSIGRRIGATYIGVAEIDCVATDAAN